MTPPAGVDVPVFPNGVNAVTRTYLTGELSAAELALGISPPDDLARASRIQQQAQGTLGLPFDVDPTDIAAARWAVVVSEQERATIEDVLSPLLRVRDGRILTYSPDESLPQWLARHRVAPGTVDPEKVPYYLLLAGSSSHLPFRFAQELAVEYAVGRLELDSAGDYRQYAEHVVAYETGPAPRTTKRVELFAPRHDAATNLSAGCLVAPLAASAGEGGRLQRLGFRFTSSVGDAASKARLRTLLSEPDDERPSVLFTASHGVGYPVADPDQTGGQGSLLCHGWNDGDELTEDVVFSAPDVGDANLGGLVAFLFACYSAGTPSHDRFFARQGGKPQQIAAEPFVAALPRKLLLGGALAVIGHVDRAWGYSIVPLDAGVQIQPFVNFLGQVLSGKPVGYAMKDFRERYAALTVTLANLLERRDYEEIGDVDLVARWTERNDAEGYMVIGDPAVRLRHREIRERGA